MAEQRGPLELVEVGLLVEDEVPVGDVGERGDRVAAQGVDPVGLDDRGDDHRHRDQDADRGQQAARAPDPEPPEPDVSAAAVLGEQQRGDQVAADHEEDVDAEEPPRHPPDARVVEEDGEHGDRPQRVDAGHVGEAMVLRPADPFSFVKDRGNLERQRRGSAASRRPSSAPAAASAPPALSKAPRTRSAPGRQRDRALDRGAQALGPQLLGRQASCRRRCARPGGRPRTDRA